MTLKKISVLKFCVKAHRDLLSQISHTIIFFPPLVFFEDVSEQEDLGIRWILKEIKIISHGEF